MTDTINDTIKEIAEKHGVALGQDDPILIMQTLNDRLLAQSTQAQKDNLDRFKTDMDAAIAAWDKQSKEKAERILNAALHSSQETLERAIEQSVRDTTSVMKEQIEMALKTPILQAVRESRKTAMINLTASVITMLSVIFVFFTLYKG